MKIEDDLTSQPEISETDLNTILQEEYPKLVERYKAMIADGIVILLGFVLASIIFSFFENAPVFIRVMSFLFLVVFYEPILISIFGCTIGQMHFGLKVKSNSNRNKNVLFPLALIRYVIKLSLGWLSFITMLSDKQKRAIHDYASGSIVLYAKK